MICELAQETGIYSELSCKIQVDTTILLLNSVNEKGHYIMVLTLLDLVTPTFSAFALS